MNNIILPDNLSWSAESAKGVRKETNEDAHDFFTLTWGKEQKPVAVMVIADGVSSTDGGGYASQVAVETIRSVLMEPSDYSETTSERMAQALTLANQEILFQSRQNPEWSRMATTVVLALMVDNRLYVMGLGDSRAYLIREQKIYRLTTDHIWTQNGPNTSHISLPNNQQAPHFSRLVRYLGNPHSFQIDRGIVSPESQEKEEYIPIRHGDTILLCSDGLYKSVSELEFNQTIQQHQEENEQAASSLIKLAQQKGETDDITALLVKISGKYSFIDLTLATLATASSRLSGRTLRFVLAIAVAFVLLIFQLNYQQGRGDGSSGGVAPQATTLDERLPSQEEDATPTHMPTRTTPQPTFDTLPENGTLPLPPTLASPTKALPTAELPTAVDGN